MLGIALKAVICRCAVVFATALIGFAVADCLGDPVGQTLTQHATLAERLKLSQGLGLDRPWHERYFTYLEDAAAGDFGHSLRTGEPVFRMLAHAAPVTIDLCVAAMVQALVVAFPLAVVTATTRSTRVRKFVDFASICASTVPVFVPAIAATAIFSATLGWLPASGVGELQSVAGWKTGLLTPTGWAALALPAGIVSVPLAALFANLLRAEFAVIYRQDFIRSARARGLSPAAIATRHAFPNALAPLIASTSLQCASILSFAIVTETVFQRPGIGWLLFKALENADYPVAIAALLWATTAFTAFGILSDILQLWVEPRLRQGRRSPHQPVLQR